MSVASLTLQAQLKLSKQAKIAVVTLGPYQGEVWSAFGHNGIRVEDPSQRIDWFYDYGLYDFNQENFFLNFAKGLLRYKASVIRWHPSFNFHKHLNRYVKLQYLNLTLDEKQQLFNFLQRNTQPENAEYLYHYVFDNCATKIRDILEEQYPNRVSFDVDYAKEDRTIRQLMDQFLDQQPWGDLGIDIGLGMEVDRVATPREYMFLPLYLYKGFAGATIEREGCTEPLVSASVDAFVPKEESFRSELVTPFNSFLILFFVVGLITHRNLKFGGRTKWLDAFLFGMAGFVGLWVVYLWVGTEHMSKNNLNILWAIPLHIPILTILRKKEWTGFFSSYFMFFGYWYAILLVLWPVLPQPIHQALVPFVLALVLRCFYLSYYLKRLVEKL